MSFQEFCQAAKDCRAHWSLAWEQICDDSEYTTPEEWQYMINICHAIVATEKEKARLWSEFDRLELALLGAGKIKPKRIALIREIIRKARLDEDEDEEVWTIKPDNLSLLRRAVEGLDQLDREGGKLCICRCLNDDGTPAERCYCRKQ